MGVGAVPAVGCYLTLLCQHLGVLTARLLGRSHLLVYEGRAELGTPLVDDVSHQRHGSTALIHSTRRGQRLCRFTTHLFFPS